MSKYFLNYMLLQKHIFFNKIMFFYFFSMWIEVDVVFIKGTRLNYAQAKARVWSQLEFDNHLNYLHAGICLPAKTHYMLVPMHCELSQQHRDGTHLKSPLHSNFILAFCVLSICVFTCTQIVRMINAKKIVYNEFI